METRGILKWMEDMIKSERLIKLEEMGVFRQDRQTGEWFYGNRQNEDLTPYLLEAWLFEH